HRRHLADRPRHHPHMRPATITIRLQGILPDAPVLIEHHGQIGWTHRTACMTASAPYRHYRDAVTAARRHHGHPALIAGTAHITTTAMALAEAATQSS